jgi:hypothetical protein
MQMKLSPFSMQLIFARLLIGSGNKDFTKHACGISCRMDR